MHGRLGPIKLKFSPLVASTKQLGANRPWDESRIPIWTSLIPMHGVLEALQLLPWEQLLAPSWFVGNSEPENERPGGGVLIGRNWCKKEFRRTPPNPKTQQLLKMKKTPCCTTSPHSLDILATTTGTDKDIAGTGIATLVPYETHALDVAQQQLSTSDEATTQSKAKSINKDRMSQPGPLAEPIKNHKNPNKKAFKKKERPFPLQISHLIGTNSEIWTKFHVLNFIGEEDEAGPNPNEMRMWSDLRYKLNNTNFTCSRRRDGSILVDAKTQENAEEIKKIKSICNKSITTARDALLNSTRGTVLIPRNVFNHVDEIEPNLLEQSQAQGLPVTNVKRFVRTTRTGKTIHLACLTFDSRTLPPYMYVGFERVEVREDLPKPRQCKNCWKFGHPAEFCQSNPCCPICASTGHHLELCLRRQDRTYKGHCPNCDQIGHTAFSRECTLYKKERETLITMRREGLTKRGAIKKLEEQGQFTGVWYARRAAQQTLRQPLPSQQKQTRQQQQQAHQQQHEQPHPQPVKQDHQIKQTTQDRQTEAILSDPDLFLSVESESMEQSSQEEVSKTVIEKPNTGLDSFPSFEEDSMEQTQEGAQSQVLPRRIQENRQKRKPEDAFPPSPPENDQPKTIPASKKKPNEKSGRRSSWDLQKRSSLEEQMVKEPPNTTSSPKKIAASTKDPEKQPKSQNLSRAEPLSPMSSVQVLDKDKGAISKMAERGSKRTTLPNQSDKQHTPNRSNCGCNSCIRDLIIVKNQHVGPKGEFSREFKEQVKNTKLYRTTALASHPPSCRCKAHMLKSFTHMETPQHPPKGERKIPDKEDVEASRIASDSLAGQGKSSSNVANIRQLFSKVTDPSVRDPRLRKQPPEMPAGPPKEPDGINKIPSFVSR